MAYLRTGDVPQQRADATRGIEYGARVLRDVTAAQDRDRRVWLADTPRGALVDHELNPRLG